MPSKSFKEIAEKAFCRFLEVVLGTFWDNGPLAICSMVLE
jgi:hypothetical protein